MTEPHASWFKARKYKHFDLPVNAAFIAKAMSPTWVSRHSFSPLIHYDKIDIKYKRKDGSKIRETVKKIRPIKYASHRDACILSYYAHTLNKFLDNFYLENGITDNIIAYRALGKANYNFAADAMKFAEEKTRCVVLAFDITGFFDNLDHSFLKKRLCDLLGACPLPDDWYKIYRFVTNYHYVELEALKKNRIFCDRIGNASYRMIATIKEVKLSNIAILKNPEISKGEKKGIPQGTPISATLSNLYMTDFDIEAKKFCDSIGALYRRYSDDILVICNESEAVSAEKKIIELIKMERLQISTNKTEKTIFDINSTGSQTGKAAQYLGFNFDEKGAYIRESSLSRQWRKMRKAIRRAKKSSEWRIKNGNNSPIFKKKLLRRYSYIKILSENSTKTLRNFSSYGRRSADSFNNSKKIMRQLRRFEKNALQMIKDLR